MRILTSLCVAVLGLSPFAAMAQETGVMTGLADASGAQLRGLDKINGIASDIALKTGQSVTYGTLEVTLDQCRYPSDDPSSNAFAHLTIHDSQTDKTAFSGWMIASSPALSALDNQRYDVWVIRCTNS
ncbi:DUF2155 domain-containing protein [Thioclava kandeliae]|uniref:DUF2155 domain-containing protein n=1 Tax=Thioclava kandeliae TaxID=3070818 RepID=A0ABV1SCV3_9RHOB